MFNFCYLFYLTVFCKTFWSFHHWSVWFWAWTDQPGDKHMVTMVTCWFGVSDEADTTATRILITAPLTLHEPDTHTHTPKSLQTFPTNFLQYLIMFQQQIQHSPLNCSRAEEYNEERECVCVCVCVCVCACVLPLRQRCVFSQTDSAAYRVRNHLLEGNSLVETLDWSGQTHWEQQSGQLTWWSINTCSQSLWFKVPPHPSCCGCCWVFCPAGGDRVVSEVCRTLHKLWCRETASSWRNLLSQRLWGQRQNRAAPRHSLKHTHTSEHLSSQHTPVTHSLYISVGDVRERHQSSACWEL